LNIEICNTLINGYSKSNQTDKAEKLLKSMYKESFPLNKIDHSPLIFAYMRNHQVDKLDEFYSKKEEINGTDLESLTEAYIALGCLKQVEEIWKWKSQFVLNAWDPIYAILIKAFFKEAVSGDSSKYNYYILLVKDIYQKLEGHTLNAEIYLEMIKGYAKLKRQAEIIEMCQEIPANLLALWNSIFIKLEDLGLLEVAKEICKSKFPSSDPLKTINFRGKFTQIAWIELLVYLDEKRNATDRAPFQFYGDEPFIIQDKLLKSGSKWYGMLDPKHPKKMRIRHKPTS
jgi:pentatricopeptide repeat protein